MEIGIKTKKIQNLTKDELIEYKKICNSMCNILTSLNIKVNRYYLNMLRNQFDKFGITYLKYVYVHRKKNPLQKI